MYVCPRCWRCRAGLGCRTSTVSAGDPHPRSPLGVGEMNHFTHDRHSTHRESRMALHCRTDLPAGRPARYLPSQVTCWPKVRNFLTSVLAIVPCILAPPHPQSPTFVPPNPAPPLSPPYLLASPCSLLRRKLPSSLLESLLMIIVTKCTMFRAT